MSKWIKKGDQVLVITGNDKGKTGTILSRSGDRVIIQGINIRKKHAKRKTKAPGAEILDIEVPVHISNVRFCTPDGKGVKVRVRESKEGAKELFYKEGKKDVVLRQVKKS